MLKSFAREMPLISRLFSQSWRAIFTRKSSWNSARALNADREAISLITSFETKQWHYVINHPSELEIHATCNQDEEWSPEGNHGDDKLNENLTKERKINCAEVIKIDSNRFFFLFFFSSIHANTSAIVVVVIRLFFETPCKAISRVNNLKNFPIKFW